MKTARALLLAAAVLCSATTVLATPGVTVSWAQQSGVTGPTASVPVLVRVSVDSGSAALDFDNLASALAGTDLSQFASISSVSPVMGINCMAGSFFSPSPLTGCDNTSAPWRWEYDFSPDSFLFGTGRVMPGEARDFMLGTFTPQNGPVATGLYSFSDATLSLLVDGTNAAGAPIGLLVTLGQTCPTVTEDCAFTRTVVAIPEPATSVLMGLGLMFVIGNLRRPRAA